MEIILNDNSLDGQFASLEDFEEYFLSDMRPILEGMEKQHINLQKKTDTYARYITKEITLNSYLRRANRTAATIMKKLIVQLYHEPHWDLENMQSRADGIYDYPGKCEEPNCFTEAMERKCPLLSFRHNSYMKERFSCKCDGKEMEIVNIYRLLVLYQWLLLGKKADIRYIFESFPFEREILFAETESRCYALEALEENDLSPEDHWKIFSNILRLIEDKKAGRKTHFWDNIEGAINEYRITVSGDREFRMLFLWEKEIVFLNGFIKKTALTPESEKKKAKNIIKSRIK